MQMFQFGLSDSSSFLQAGPLTSGSRASKDVDFAGMIRRITRNTPSQGKPLTNNEEHGLSGWKGMPSTKPPEKGHGVGSQIFRTEPVLSETGTSSLLDTVAAAMASWFPLIQRFQEGLVDWEEFKGISAELTVPQFETAEELQTWLKQAAMALQAEHGEESIWAMITEAAGVTLQVGMVVPASSSPTGKNQEGLAEPVQVVTVDPKKADRVAAKVEEMLLRATEARTRLSSDERTPIVVQDTTNNDVEKMQPTKIVMDKDVTLVKTALRVESDGKGQSSIAPNQVDSDTVTPTKLRFVGDAPGLEQSRTLAELPAGERITAKPDPQKLTLIAQNATDQADVPHPESSPAVTLSRQFLSGFPHVRSLPSLATPLESDIEQPSMWPSALSSTPSMLDPEKQIDPVVLGISTESLKVKTPLSSLKENLFFETDSASTSVTKDDRAAATSRIDNKTLVADLDRFSLTLANNTAKERTSGDIIKPQSTADEQYVPLTKTDSTLSSDVLQTKALTDSDRPSSENYNQPQQETLQRVQPQPPQTTAPEMPRTVMPEEVTAQIVDKMQMLSTAERGEIRIQLQPDYLGDVRIRVVVEQGIVTAQFAAENQAVKEILQSQFNQLRSNLEEMGLQVDQITVDVGGSFEQGSSQQNHELEQDSMLATKVPSQAIHSNETDPSSTAAVSTDGSVNLRI